MSTNKKALGVALAGVVLIFIGAISYYNDQTPDNQSPPQAQQQDNYQKDIGEQPSLPATREEFCAQNNYPDELCSDLKNKPAPQPTPQTIYVAPPPAPRHCSSYTYGTDDQYTSTNCY